RAGDRIRVTVRLSRVADGRVLWAESFNQPFTDIFSVQDAIAAQVSTALVVRLSEDDKRQLSKRSTDNTQAYELYLKGRYGWNNRAEEGIRKSSGYFQQAAAIAPTYALPYAGLADAYGALTSYSDIAPNDAFPRAKEAATTALRLDEALPEAHTALGFVHEAFDWQWAEAEREYQRALTLNPSYAVGHHRYGMFLCEIGRCEEGIAQVEEAHRLDPTSMIINADQGLAYYLGRHYQQATEQLRIAVDMEPAFARSHVYLAYAYVQQKNFDAAIAEGHKATELTGGRAGAPRPYA